MLLLIKFNPCFGGFCSKTVPSAVLLRVVSLVSILVLVDFALKPKSSSM